MQMERVILMMNVRENQGGESVAWQRSFSH